MKRLEDIFSKGQLRRYKKGQIILHQGDELTDLFYIRKGYVKIYNILETGEERILLFLRPHEAFPMVASIYVTDHTLRYFYEAMTDVEVNRVPQPEFSNLIRDNFRSIQVVLEYITRLNEELVQRLETLENKNAEEKIARTLPYLIEKFGKEVKPDCFKLRLKLTHQDIANMTGLTRETASIQIKRLEQSKVLYQQRGSLVIDNKKLARLLQ